MLYKAYFRSLTTDKNKVIVDIYSNDHEYVEMIVHIPLNDIFMYNGSSIMFSVNYNIIHKRLAMVNVNNIDNITKLHVVSMLDGI